MTGQTQVSDTADEDGDDIGIDEGMEPESPTGADPSDDDDNYDDGDGDGGEVQVGGPVARVVSGPKGARPISDKVRALMKEAAAKMKASGGADAVEEYEPLDHDDAPMEPPDVKKPMPSPVDATGAAPSGPGQAVQAQVPQAAAPIPPAPSMDPEVVRLREEWASKQAELDAREQRLLEAERAGDIAKLRDVYFERGAPAVVEIVKKWAGTLTDDELKDEISDLITDLSGQVLGVDLPQEVRDRLESRRTRKSVKVWKADQERQAKELADKQTAAQEEQNRVRVKGILTQEITKPEHASNYPWLLAEAEDTGLSAGEIIFDIVETALKKDGTRLTWQEAAKRGNDYLQKKYAALFDKRRSLLTTANGQGSTANGKQQRTQGDQQVRRSQAPQQPPPKQPATPPTESERWNPEAHRRAVKAKFRNAFTRTDEE